MPAALCAMDRALIVLVREGNVLLWEEFRDEFKKDFWRSLPLGLLFGGLLFLGYFLLSLGMGNFGTFLGPMFFAFGLFAIGLALGRGSYAFLMRAMFDLPNGQILKNANGMSALRGGRGWLPIVVHGVGFLFGTGGSALIGKTMGEGDRKHADRLFSMVICVTACTPRLHIWSAR